MNGRRMPRGKPDVRRAVSGGLLMAAGAGLLIYHLGDLSTTNLATAGAAFVAGVVLVARRAR